MDQLPPPGQLTTINGQITDRATQRPIAGATVTIDTVLTATTDAAGKFSIDKVPAGTVDYAVTAHGYATSAASITAAPGQPFTLNLALDRSASSP